MVSAAVIRMNYVKTLFQASQLEAKAGYLRKLARVDLSEAIYHTDSGWNGANSDLFKRKVETLRDQVIRYAEQLDRTASTIRRVAKRVYDAEMAALALI